MSFWDIQKERAILLKIRRAKTLAKRSGTSDYSIKYPAEAKAARQSTPNYTELTTRIKDEMAKYFKKQDERSEKLGKRL